MNTGRTRFKKGHKHSEKWYKVMKALVPWHKGIKMTETQKLRMRGHKKPNATGDKNHNWKGGITPDRDIFRKTIQKTILKRDDFTCQICGKRGGLLQVDHIQEWSKYVEGRFNIDNCRTLCPSCHYFITFNRPMPVSVKYWGNSRSKRKSKSYDSTISK